MDGKSPTNSSRVGPALGLVRGLLAQRDSSELTDEAVLAAIDERLQTGDGLSNAGKAILQQAAGAFMVEAGLRAR